jgi:hypothetical protein
MSVEATSPDFKGGKNDIGYPIAEIGNKGDVIITK